jgi:hypothetical protein
LAFYVDDFIYFSASDAVERNFESLFSTVGNVDFMGQVSLFHGIEFSWLHLSDGHINAGLMQQPLLKLILNLWGLKSVNQSTFLTPHHSGLPNDSNLHEPMLSAERDTLCQRHQSLVGSLNWLAHTTRPDLSTVMLLFAPHQSNNTRESTGCMNFWVLKMYCNSKQLRSYNYLLLCLCQYLILIFLVHITGFLRVKKSPLVAQMKLKSMPNKCEICQGFY